MTIWTKEISESYLDLGKQSHVDLVFAAIKELRSDLRGCNLLDFGCGDGRLSRQFALEGPNSFVLMDENHEMLEGAKNSLSALPLTLRDRIHLIQGNETVLPFNSKFDAAVCSLTLMMMETRGRIDQAMQGLVQSLSPKGKLWVVITHPCFHEERHEEFHLETSPIFHYWDSGSPYRVVLDNEKVQPVRFIDYHWTIEDYSRAVEKGGGTIHRLRELPGPTDKVRGPRKDPAYLLLEIAPI
ncbi:MAG: class I SAM-dependent methyltransferase [Candidatus Omnitrophica bacterium]|nr:class I SAM-dependent methyltransferase [Candidatus Omnitrophota bacterium]